ncbi:hypothetical protein OIU77_006345 [Salix suchowensis]|uniref:Uncharacterized protein n=1 Tax=Salix suchowensis TaxID=1278906 RepID=A0ABQ9ALU1_9ROSI|nr:hypothetical protein OIU77_006345 [Salix suchowensis]
MCWAFTISARSRLSVGFSFWTFSSGSNFLWSYVARISYIHTIFILPLSHGYPEQQAANNAGYGSQGSVAPPTQQGYAQPTPTQPSYDQSVPQSAGYRAAPAAAPAGYGKTVSPQPGYPQYDSTQVYAAPR